MYSKDFLFIVISQQEVLDCDTAPALITLRSLMQSPDTACRLFGKVDIAIDGYTESPYDLCEIQEVRKFIYELDGQFPYWLFFMSKQHTGLQSIAHCLFSPPFLTEAAKAERFPQYVDTLLTNRWFPAMNQVCEWVGMPEEEIEALSDEAVEYLLSGPTK